MDLQEHTPFLFPNNWINEENSEIDDIVYRRISRAPDRIKKYIPLLQEAYDVNFITDRDVLIVSILPTNMKSSFTNAINRFGTPFPGLYTIDQNSSGIAIRMLGTYNGFIECNLSLIYIGPGSIFAIHRSKYKSSWRVRPHTSTIQIPLSIFVRLGGQINRFNCFEWLEEAVVNILEGISNTVRTVEGPR